MTEEEAISVAKVLGGDAWNSGGNIWLVRFQRSDGKLVLISDEVVCEYTTEESTEPINSILLH